MFLYPYITNCLSFPTDKRYESDFNEAATSYGSGLVSFLIENTEGQTKQQLQALPADCRLSLRFKRTAWRHHKYRFPALIFFDHMLLTHLTCTLRLIVCR